MSLERRGSGDAWLRQPRSRLLLGTALVMSLGLAVGFVAVDASPPSAPALPGPALSDEQAAAQVVDAARQIVATAQLRETTGGYTFMSCSAANEPPYQAALHMTFALPQLDSARFLDHVASAMATGGWSVAAATGEHFGHKLVRGGVIAEFSRATGDRGFATMRIYGECRNTADHRDDDPAWTPVSL